MKKIAVVTATRAEFGLLLPVLKSLRNNENKDLYIDLIVTGTHLYDQYGMTVNEIVHSGMRIDHRIKIPVDSQSELDISRNQADTLIKFTELFVKNRYNAVVLLGDRYETLAIAVAAGNTRTPVFHLCGGDTTEGALDEWIRHSITKISYIHFVTNAESRKRVIQLGEDPQRVFNYGSTSIDNILTEANLSRQEALNSIGLGDCKYAICTYHPVTMENEDTEAKITAILETVKCFPEIQFVFTKSNSDQGGARINRILEDAKNSSDNIHVFCSLGVRRYLSLMKYAEFILGNSSSGIIEAPAFHIPTINIGDRQRGRYQTDSIINCGEETSMIMNAIRIAMSKEFKLKCSTVTNPYGDGHAGEKIANKCIEMVCERSIDLKKKFYDLKTQ